MNTCYFDVSFQNWENQIASQMYMLIWIDFFLQVVVALVVTTIWKWVLISGLNAGLISKGWVMSRFGWFSLMRLSSSHTDLTKQKELSAWSSVPSGILGSTKMAPFLFSGPPLCRRAWYFHNLISELTVYCLLMLFLCTLCRLLYKHTACFKKLPIGLPEFDIPKHVLTLVYGECLIW